jgi:CrcB protein
LVTRLERLPPVALVAIGGALGALARVALIDACASQVDAWMTTTAINCFGSVIAGFVWATLAERARDAGRMRRLAWSALVISGFCGGFTTFSGFGLQTAELAREGRHGAAIANLWISLVHRHGRCVCGSASGQGVASAEAAGFGS